VDWDATDRLKDVKAPALILYGTEDSVFPAQGSLDMCRLIPAVEQRAFEGAEHGVAQLPESIELILSFVKRHSPV
jgi:pimeloyl-ACP methyl ester carboxylesterase